VGGGVFPDWVQVNFTDSPFNGKSGEPFGNLIDKNKIDSEHHILIAHSLSMMM
jgi:hypothetical protein